MADRKITQLAAAAAVTLDDLFVLVDSPGLLPTTKKVTAAVVQRDLVPIVIAAGVPGAVDPAGHWYFDTLLGRLWRSTGVAWQFVGYTSLAGRPGVILTDAAQAIPNGAATLVTWGTEVSDVDGWTSGASGSLTVPAGWTGEYALSYTGTWAGAAGAANSVGMLLNAPFIAESGTSSVFLRPSVTVVRRLVAADVIQYHAFQTSGAPVNLDSRLEIAWLGP